MEMLVKGFGKYQEVPWYLVEGTAEELEDVKKKLDDLESSDCQDFFETEIIEDYDDYKGREDEGYNFDEIELVPYHDLDF